MKTFALTRISERDEKYHVFLTWGKSFEFTRHKAAVAFLSDTNRFLTRCLVELNDFYCDLQLRFRKNWLLFFHNKSSHGFTFYQDERTCDRCLSDVKDLLTIAFDRHRYVNGSSMVFENFKKCFDCLLNVCRVLRKYYHRRSETVDVWQIDIAISSLIEKRRALELWGVDAAKMLHTKMTIAYQQVIPLSEYQTNSVN